MSLAASRINWDFGLVVGAIFVKEGARQVRIDHRLLVDPARLADGPSRPPDRQPTPAERLENSPVLMWQMGAPGLIWLAL